MEQNVSALLTAKNDLVKQGAIVDATEKFFAPNAQTRDFEGTVTTNKAEMLVKMNGFAGAIQAVNGITLHNTSIDGNVSFAEFTFDFDMKDGSKILWHEILRREWQNDKIVSEQYFKL